MMLWDPKLETGVPQIDEQHKELFRRVDALLTAGKERRGKEEIENTLNFLEQYVVQHFRDEGALQLQSAYPQSLEHKQQHTQYVAELQTLKEQYTRDGASLTVMITLNRSIVEWLTNHINTYDREFAAYYRAWKDAQKK